MIGVSKEAMQQEGRSYWLSYNPHHLADIGRLGRLVVAGWSIEVYRPMRSSRLGAFAERLRLAAES